MHRDGRVRERALRWAIDRPVPSQSTRGVVAIRLLDPVPAIRSIALDAIEASRRLALDDGYERHQLRSALDIPVIERRYPGLRPDLA